MRSYTCPIACPITGLTETLTRNTKTGDYKFVWAIFTDGAFVKDPVTGQSVYDLSLRSLVRSGCSSKPSGGSDLKYLTTYDRDGNRCKGNPRNAILVCRPILDSEVVTKG